MRWEIVLRRGIRDYPLGKYGRLPAVVGGGARVGPAESGGHCPGIRLLI